MKRWLLFPLFFILWLTACQNDPAVISPTANPPTNIAAATVTPTYTPTITLPTALPTATFGPTPVPTRPSLSPTRAPTPTNTPPGSWRLVAKMMTTDFQFTEALLTLPLEP